MPLVMLWMLGKGGGSSSTCLALGSNNRLRQFKSVDLDDPNFFMSFLWPFCFCLLDFLGSVFSAFFRFLPVFVVEGFAIHRAKFKIYRVFRRNHNKSYQIITKDGQKGQKLKSLFSVWCFVVGDWPSCQDSDWLCGSLDSPGSGSPSTAWSQQLAWFRKVGHRGKRRQGAATNIRYVTFAYYSYSYILLILTDKVC